MLATAQRWKPWLLPIGAFLNAAKCLLFTSIVLALPVFKHLPLVLLLMAGWTCLPAWAQVPALTKDSLVAAQSRKQDRAVTMRIVVPSALLGVGVLAHSPVCNQTLYQAKQETQEVFSGFYAHGIDDCTRHVPPGCGLRPHGHRG